MKILKYVLIIVAVILIGGWALVATQPDSYDVNRTRLIKAPASVIFNNLNDFKNWEEWGPWQEEDPSIVVSYPEQTSGIGASYSWTSNDGPGSLKTVALVENKSLDQKIQFDDFEPSDVYWRLEEIEEGTNVTWGIKAEKTPFMFKLFAAFSGGMDGMMGPMEEKGLENLDAVIMEELANQPPSPTNFTIGEISQKELPAQTFIGYFQKAKIEELSALFQEFMPKAGMHAAQNNLEFGDYIPAAVYTKWDEEKGETEFYIGLMLDKELAPAKGMDIVEIDAGKVVTLSKFGNYGEGDMEAHTNIATFFENNNLEYGKLVWELFMNDPEEVTPEEIQTDIYYQVK
ncbi:MAG: GyrI-like domain-containing protein [Bacteroidetes bacterium]|nr:GyrI-like domain-containing protein [Bacteroidota bacterium]